MKPTGNLVADTICRSGRNRTHNYRCRRCRYPHHYRRHPRGREQPLPRLRPAREAAGPCRADSGDLPVVGFPTRLQVRVPRFLCGTTPCPRKIFQASLSCADDGSKLTHRVTRWILQRLAIDRMSVSATAKALGIGWDLVNQVALDACRQLVYDDPHHLDGVRILGVDEHVWKHTRKPGEPSNLVTILVDLTPLVDDTGPARLLDIRPGRSAQVLRTWLQERDPGFRQQVQVVTMDGFTDYASAVDQVLPEATKVMDPFHLVHLAADKLTGCRQ